MSSDLSERIAGILGADQYDGLKSWWNEDKYKKKRRTWFAGACIFLTLFILLVTNCGGPDVGDPDEGPASTLVE